MARWSPRRRRRAGAGGGWGLTFAAALLLLGGPRSAAALPFLHLFMQGEVETLGRGGAEAFKDLGAEARRLQRPTLLADLRETTVSVFLDNELTLALRAGSWAGTRADDQLLGLTAAIPLGEPIDGLPITFLAGLRRESALTRLRSSEEGTLFRLEEERDWAIVGFSSRLPYGFSLGGSIEQSSQGPQWLAEVRYQPVAEAALWLRHHQDAEDYRVQIPDGAAKKVYSPALTYAIQLQRSDLEVGGAYRLERLWAQGGILATAPFDFWGEVGGMPLPWLTLRFGGDRSVDRYDDRVQAEGTGAVASVDLGMRRDRLFGGADLELGARDSLTIRYVYSMIQSLSHAEEVGTNAAQAFLHVDYDFGLLFRSGYRIQGHQLAVGWSHSTSGGIDYSLGAQYFRLILPPGAYELTSDVLDQALVAEAIDPTAVDLVGLTGSIDVPIGSFQLGAAMGQYLPIAVHQPGAAAAAPSSGGSKSKGSWLDRLAQGVRDYGGGNRLLFRLTTHF